MLPNSEQNFQRFKMKITKQDFVDYINKQPDNREVNFSENDSSHSCGCLMVHYFKDLGFNNFRCGSSRIVDYDDFNKYDYIVLDYGCRSIVIKGVISRKMKTYKDLKECLTKE